MNKYPLILLFIICSISHSQNLTESLIYDIKTLNIKGASELISEAPSSFYKKEICKLFKIQIDLLKYGSTENNYTKSKHNFNTHENATLNALSLMTEADIMKHSLMGQDSIIFKKYQKALIFSSEINNKPISCEILKRLLLISGQNSYLLNNYTNYLNIYEEYLYDDYEKINHELLRLHFKSVGKRDSFIPTYKMKAKEIPETFDYAILKARIYRMIGTNYDLALQQYDSAYFYHEKSIKIYNSYQCYFTKEESFSSLINQGIVLNQQKKYNQSNTILNNALKIKLRKDKIYNKELAYNWISKNYKALKKHDSAVVFLERKISLKDSINHIFNAENINYLNTKFETEKKEKENLQLESKQKKTRSYLILALVILFFGTLTAILIQKNTKRKQKLAEQEKELETQKLATVLKEQELTSIDAMIEGQEKERQRIANDLHDDLGGLMATVKLHFNALKEKQTPELYKKTNELIDEAYDKVRTVAHAKNSGVIANQGLLKAINEMADKISTSNKITINVVDHGLENRLENSLELTLFRIIQELITNTIKHAEATEVTIHITNHEDSLNLMVEDNGKGFNPSQITKTNKGMGISSIDKRVEHLNGTLTIESEKNQGTTIIIDIPI